MGERTATAAVMVNGLATRYWRCGSGQTVILLGANQALATRLARSCRVIAPEIPVAADFAEWLRGILEGLGIYEAIVVAAPDFLEDARAFATTEPERLRGVISLNEAPSLE